MKTKLLLLLSIFSLCLVNAQNTYVPDDNFEQALIDLGYDDTLDDYVTTANIADVTDLNLYNKGITDLTGLEDFTSLFNFDASSNALIGLDVSQNTSLEYLYCANCNLTTIDVSANVNLRELSLISNSITTIDLSSNSLLIAIDLDNNSISSIDVSNNSDLEWISINNNQLTSLDVSNNSGLITLRVYTNQLSSLDVSQNVSLRELLVQTNQLSSLNIKNGNNSNFKIENGERTFDARNNKGLTCIQVDDVDFSTTNFTKVDFGASFSTDCAAQQGLTFVPDNNFEQALIDLGFDEVLDDYVTTDNINTLTTLDISNKQIADLTGIQDFTALENLNISSNALTELSLSNTALTVLNCNNNQITTIDVVNLSSLLELSANNNQITTIDTSGSFGLLKLEVNNNQISELMLLGNYSLTHLDCSFNNITNLDITSSFSLEEITANNNKIKNLSFAGISTLTKVVVNNNELLTLSIVTGGSNSITDFNSLNNPNLYCIEVDDANYATTNFTNKDAQASFSTNCNYFEQTYVPDDLFEQFLIDMGYDDVLDDYVYTINIKNLKSLEIENINIDVLTGLEAFVSLETLILKNLSFDEIDLTPFTNLKTLNLFRNLLQNVDVSSNTKLETLTLTENRLTTLDVSQNINLQSLSLGYNDFVTTIDLSANTKLKFFDILGNDLGNQITTIDFSNNPLLEEVQLGGNELTSIDISSNTNLKKLSVIGNNISTIDVSNNLALENLGVSNNNLSSLDVSMLENLGFLYTQGNNLNCVSVFDVAYANQQWKFYADDTTLFVADCSDLVYVPDDLLEQKFIDLGYDTVLDDYILSSDVADVITLQIENINIDDLTGLEAFTSLEVLILSNLSFDDIDLSPFTNLRILSLFRNLLQNVDVTNNPALEELNLTENNLTTLNLSQNPNLQNLSISYNDFTSINLSANPKLKYFNALGNSQGNQITSIDFSNNPLLEEVTLQGNLLTTIDVSANTNLTRLFIPNNNIESIDVSNNLALERLSVSNNNLSSLDVSMLENLGFLYTDGNNLTCVSVFDVAYANQQFTQFADSNTLFVADCSDLVYVPDDLLEQKFIDLGYDDVLDDYILASNVADVTSLEIENINIDVLTGLEAFVSLETLILKNLSFDEIDLTPFTNLKTLNLFRNLLQNVDVTNNIALEELFLSENRLTTIDLSQNINLQNLSLAYNDFTSVDISTNVKLKVLNILGVIGSNDGNQLTSINLSNNPLLEEVQIQGNQLNSIDVSANTNLKSLSVPSNNIETIDVSNNLMLESLGLSNNNLSALDVSMLENLGFLYTEGNNLTCVSVFDVAYANQQFTQFADSTTIFVEDCNDLVYMPDDEFEKLFDLTPDNYVLRSAVEARETLFISTSMITDYTGLEAFINLKEFTIISDAVVNSIDFSANILLERISTQDIGLQSVILPNTETLKFVDFYNNNLTNIDVSGLVNLEELLLTGNNLNSLDVSSNVNLFRLLIGGNEIENIDIANNSKLGILEASFMGFDTFMGLTSIDVSNNRLLEDLNIRGNNISVLDITNNFRLTAFEARSNNLSCIKVWDVDYANENWSDNIDANASFSETCNVTEIPDENFEQALIDANIDDVLDGFILTENASSRQSLTLSSKNISDLTGIEAFTSLTNLTLKGNNLTSIDLSQNTALTSLNISINQLDRLDISNNVNLTTFDAKENPDLTCIQVWDVTYAENNWSNKIDATASFSEDCDDVWTVEVDKDVKDILRIINGIDKDNDGEITLKEAKEFVGGIDLSNKNIKDIKGLQAFENITSLNLSGNNLKDLSALTGKKITLVSKTTGKKRQVTAKASKLETLIISGNSFETLNLEELKDLKVIDLSNNPNLGTISIKNGNNAAITSFISTNTPNLSCILVDNKNANYLENWSKDAASNFVSDIADCRSKILSTNDFSQKDITIYPNPVTNFLTVESTKEFDFIVIYNTIGKRVIKTQETKIDFSNYTAGIYIIKIVAKNKVLTKRVIKN